MRSAAFPLTILLLGIACAPRSGNRSVPNPAEIARLEQKARQDSTNVDALVKLGASYRAANRLQDAIAPLARAARRPGSNAAVLLLGATYEDLERYADARALYQSYLTSGKSAALRRDLGRRLVLLERKEIEAAAKVAVRRERELAGTQSLPGTVAIMPFSTQSSDSTVQLIARALTDMLITDLSQTNRIRVLERLRVQALLAEIGLGATGRVDSASAARSGRMLRAERIVQGSLAQQNNQLIIQAAVASVQTVRGARPRTPIAERDVLNRLFDLEKRTALRLYDALGITLTVAEREAVERRATQNLQALLAYARGLRDLDAGRYEQAARHFSMAARLDAGFTAASRNAAAAADLATAFGVSTLELTNRALRELAQIPGWLDLNLLQTPFDRDAVSEILGAEGGARGIFLELIFRRPGSNP